MSTYCNGYYQYGRCRSYGGLGYGSRIGIGVAVAAAVVIVIALFSVLAARKRRRRLAAHNVATTSAIPMDQSNPYATGGGYNTGYAHPSPYGQTHQAQSYGPPPGPPPANNDEAIYAPPPGAPPPAYVPNNGTHKNAENMA